MKRVEIPQPENSTARQTNQFILSIHRKKERKVQSYKTPYISNVSQILHAN